MGAQDRSLRKCLLPGRLTLRTPSASLAKRGFSRMGVGQVTVERERSGLAAAILESLPAVVDPPQQLQRRKHLVLPVDVRGVHTSADRALVLESEEADNGALATACKKHANLRWDNLAVFKLKFTPNEVNDFEYFHPSLIGQNRLASINWAVSWWPEAKRALRSSSGGLQLHVGELTVVARIPLATLSGIARDRR